MSVRWEYFRSTLLATYNAILLTIIITLLYFRSPEFIHLVTGSLISLQSKGLSRVFSQHHSSKASILQRSAFFMVQLSHLYMTTGKTIADANRDLKCTCTVELVPLWLYYHYRRTCSGLSASHRRKGCLWSWSICSLELRPADPEMYAWEWITFFKSHSVWGWFVMQHSSDSCCLTHLVTGSLKKAIQEWQSLASNMLLETQAFATSLLYYL